MPITAVSATTTTIPVVLAVVQRDNRVLIGWREQSLPQGGCWEFPGGKVGPNETPPQALTRELLEEIGIKVDAVPPTPLIKFNWCYETGTYAFKAYSITEFEGVPRASFYRKLKWQPLTELDAHQFPPANRAIINAVQLPDKYLLTPVQSDTAKLVEGLRVVLTEGVRLATFRAPQLTVQSYLDNARQLNIAATSLGARLLLHNYPQFVEEVGAAGVHISAVVARAYKSRPLSKQLLFAVSCHNAEELEQALQLEADFAVLGPLQKTASHPHAPLLGWQAFQSLVEDLPLPVYAIGGLGLHDLPVCRAHGGQGIAAIRSLWQSSIASAVTEV